jgi:hypothetical protein
MRSETERSLQRGFWVSVLALTRQAPSKDSPAKPGEAEEAASSPPHAARNVDLRIFTICSGLHAHDCRGDKEHQ